MTLLVKKQREGVYVAALCFCGGPLDGAQLEITVEGHPKDTYPDLRVTWPSGLIWTSERQRYMLECDVLAAVLQRERAQ